MFKKRTHKLWVITGFLQLFMHALLQLFAFHQRFSDNARALGMTPNELVRVEVWRVAGQEVQEKTPSCAGHILLDHLFLMRRQTIHHQMQRPTEVTLKLMSADSNPLALLFTATHQKNY